MFDAYESICLANTWKSNIIHSRRDSVKPIQAKLLTSIPILNPATALRITSRKAE